MQGTIKAVICPSAEFDGLTCELEGTNTLNVYLHSRTQYGERWKNGFTLEVLLRHEIHHRGRMTVLMRQAGLKVPGVYGPAMEEWEAFGAQPPEV